MSLKIDTKPKPTYFQDELFDQTMRQFQKGEWNDGLENLARLLNRYPGDKELTALNKEMLVRARIDEYEKQEDRRKILSIILRYVLLGSLVLVVAYGAFWSVREYSGYVQEQFDSMQAAAQENTRQLQIFARFRDAQNLLLADRPNEALAKFQEIKEIQPDYPNLDLYIDQAETMSLIEDEYTYAQSLYDEFKYAEALEIFNRINQTIPNYRDVPLKIEQLNGFSELESFLRAANTAFEQGQWEEAITNYASLRAKDSSYQKDFVERRLYESYLNAAQAILDNPEHDLERLRTADVYYSKALAIFTRDVQTADIVIRVRKSLDQALFTLYVDQANQKLDSASGSLLEMSAANALLRSALRLVPDDQALQGLYQTNDRFLQAADQFIRGEWDLTILNMDVIVTDNAEFASGAAAQTLIDALMERGRNSLLVNDFATALGDFQKAADIAELLPNNTLVKLVTQGEVARTTGLLNRPEDAVQIYHQIVNETGLLSIANRRNQDLAQKLVDAQTFADIGNYQAAYTTFREAFDNLANLMSTVSYTVQDGDYLPWLARQNGTTTDLIMQISALLNRRIENGDVITIPFLPSANTP